MSFATPGGTVATPRDRSHGRSRSTPRWVLGSLVLGMSLACTDGSLTTVIHDDSPASLALASLTLVSGDDQVGEVGAFLPGPLVVEVYDSAGVPIGDAPIQWTFVQGAGRQGASTPSEVVQLRTDAAGRASLDWQLGTTAGAQTGWVEIVLPAATSPASGPAGAPGPGPGNSEFTALGHPASVNDITVTPGGLTMEEGESVQLEAQVSDRYGNTIDSVAVDWSSEDAAVAVVDSDGMVWASGPGTTMVMAKHGQIEGTATVQASGEDPPPNQPPIAWIASPGSSITIVLGATIDPQGGSSDADGAVVSHSWSFGDGSSASVADPGPHTYGQTGTYTVSYQVTDDDGAQSAVVTRLITVIDDDPPPPGDRVVLFHSDWSTATGTSSAALYDTDKAKPWTDGWFDSNSTVVIAEGDSLDFPTPNVLANRLSTSMGGGQVKILERDDYFDPPAIGESIYFRFYRRIALPNSHTGDQTTHGFHDDTRCCSDMNLSLTLSTTTSGTYGLEIGTGYAANDTIAFWSTPNSALQKFQTYRMEFRVHRVSHDGFKLEARVYDSSDQLVLSNQDFTATGWGARGNHSLADGKVLNFASSRGVNALLDLRLGLNGIGGVSGTYPHGYWGAFAVCANDWCGPYRDGM